MEDISLYAISIRLYDYTLNLIAYTIFQFSANFTKT